jgi:hypothetical protein
MVNRIDLLLNNNDVVIVYNDLVLAESDDQHIADTINACPGWWKENYMDGVQIMKYLKGKNAQELARTMKLNLQSDGYNARPILSFDKSGTLIIQTNVTN